MASTNKEQSETNSPVIAMRGAGYYSANTVGAKAVIDAAADLVLEALESMPLKGTMPFAIADYGAADGGTSIDMMRKAIARIRKDAPERQIAITYTDLPHNDFSVLFQLLQGLLPAYKDNPLALQPNVFTFGSGMGFYRQIFPDSTVSLGFSATAMHWLSKLPLQIADHTHAVGANPAEKQSCARPRSPIGIRSCCIARARWCPAASSCSRISARTSKAITSVTPAG